MLDRRAKEFLKLCQIRYYNDPVKFSEEVLKIKLTDNQQKPALNALANGKKKVAIKSGHGTGKSCLAACGILWFLCCRPKCNVLLTAPSANQLYKTMMKEIRDWYNKSILKNFDLFRFTKDSVRINSDSHAGVWFLSAVSVANPENIAGTHAHSVLAVVDEGAGVDAEIFVRLEGAMTTEDVYFLTCGNPSFTSGYFYDIFHNKNYSKDYDLFTFSCIDSTNVKEKFINDMKEKYGEDSPIYKVRVLGEFASMNENVVIERDKIKRAIGRELIEKQDTGVIYIGVDISSGDGSDYSCICIREGLQELDRRKIKVRLSKMKTEIANTIQEWRNKDYFVIANIDTTGLGTQIGQDLYDEYYYDDDVVINKVNFSFRAVNSSVYHNVATEMFFCLGDIIDKISLLDIPDSTAEEDLGVRRLSFDIQNRYVVERKKDLIKRLGHSPDEGDAILLAFYEEREDSTLIESFIEEGY